MEVFEWYDERESMRWKVRVSPWGRPGAPSWPGHVTVEFRADDRVFAVQSPVHPECRDDAVLEELVDWAREVEATARRRRERSE